VPVYLRPTIREWLAGNDVRKPRKPVKKAAAKKTAKKSAKKAAKKGAKKVSKKLAHPHVAERHATRGEKSSRTRR
jgi:hypothetical protein